MVGKGTACALLALALLAASIWHFSSAAPTIVAPDRADAERRGADTPARTDAPEQRRTPLDPDPGSELVRITGRVVDRYGEGLAGATVVETSTRQSATAADDGRFELRIAGTPDGPVALLVHTGEHAPAATEVEVDASGSADAGDLTLHRGGTLTGRVLEEGGDAAAGATVSLRCNPAAAWPGSLNPNLLLTPTACAADGRFTFANLMPGRFLVEASAPGRQTAQSSGQVQVGDEATVEVDPLRLAAGFALAGRVVGPAGEPLASAEVQVRCDRPRYRGRATTSAEGRFRIDGLPAGPLRVEVTCAGFLGATREGVDPTTGEELVVQLEAGLRIHGTVIDAARGTPVEHFAASVRRIGHVDPPANGTMSQQLTRRIAALRKSADQSRDAESRAQALRIAAALEQRLAKLTEDQRARPSAVPEDPGAVEHRPGGAFAFAGLEEGLYSVAIASPDHRVALLEPIEVRRGVDTPALHLALTRGIDLRGVVVAEDDGAPLAGAEVELRVVLDAPQPREERRALYPWAFARGGPGGIAVMRARTGEDGRFAFRHAAPGPCFVTVRGEAIADHDTEVFEVAPGQPELRVAVGRRARLTGRVRGAAPGAGAVEVLVLGGHGTLRTTRAAADGGYSFTGLQPGSYVVRAFPAAASRYTRRLVASIFPLHAGAVDAAKIPERDVTLGPGETLRYDVLLDLPRTGAVRGSFAVDGAPAKGGHAVLRPVAAPGSGGLSLGGAVDEHGVFTVSDVPAGEYTLLLSGAEGHELHRAPITVEAGTPATADVAVRAGGLRGRITLPEGSPAVQVSGVVWLLPGQLDAPDDLHEFRRTGRTHRLPVRDGAFHGTGLTPGHAIVVVDLRGHSRAVTYTTIPVGSTLELDLAAGRPR